MMRAILTGATAALLAGSAAAKEVEAGPYPADFAQQVQADLDVKLRDPGSAVVKLTRAPRLGGYKLDPWLLAKRKPAWTVCYLVNAKNGFGGYVGARTYLWAFVGGRIAAFRQSPYMDPRLGEIRDFDVEAECALAADPPPAA